MVLGYKTSLKELQYHERIHNLVDANWAAQQIANHATAARTEVENAVDHLVTGIESEHSISVNRDNINRALATAFRAIESYPGIVAAEVESSSQSGLE